MAEDYNITGGVVVTRYAGPALPTDLVPLDRLRYQITNEAGGPLRDLTFNDLRQLGNWISAELARGVGRAGLPTEVRAAALPTFNEARIAELRAAGLSEESAVAMSEE